MFQLFEEVTSWLTATEQARFMGQTRGCAKGTDRRAPAQQTTNHIDEAKQVTCACRTSNSIQIMPATSTSRTIQAIAQQDAIARIKTEKAHQGVKYLETVFS